MLFLVSGTPNARTLFGVEVARALVEIAFTDVDFGHISTVEQFHTLFKSRKGEVLMVFIETPERRVAELLARSRIKVGVFEDGLENVTGFLMAHHRSDFRSALRYAALSASSLATLSSFADVVSFAAPTKGTQLLAFIQSVALFLGLEPDEALVTAVARRLELDGLDRHALLRTGVEARFPAAAKVKGVLDALPAFERDILADLAKGYDGLSGGEAAVTLAWPPEFCLSGDRLDDYLSFPVDMTGRARPLSYGPYLHLPAGQWQMAIELEVAGNLSGNGVEILVTEKGVTRAEQEFDIPAQARIEATLPLVIDNPRDPIEIYVKTREGAIEGLLWLRSIRFSAMTAA